MTISGRARIGAGLIAILSWAGILLLLVDQADRMNGNIAAALWWNARYFTDLSNLLIAICFSLLAIRPRVIGAIFFGMPLVSTLMATAVFYGLLGGASALGSNGPGDVVAHAIVPPLVLLYWLAAIPKGTLLRRHIVLWASFPLGYCAYAIGRGLIDGRYPYFFLNIVKLGPIVAAYIGAILLLFCIIGAIIVAVDGWLARRPVPR